MNQMHHPDSLFPPGACDNRRVVITGPVGVDKRPWVEDLAKLAESRGHSVSVFHIGDMMYREAPDIVPGRILDLPLARLTSLRRAVFKDVLANADQADIVLVNTHASFRWKHGLFPAFDHDQMLALNADLYITLVDNVQAAHERLGRDHDVQHTLKDVLVWREEEILATEVLASAIRGHGCFYILARGEAGHTVETAYRMIAEPATKRVYPSFPMTHVMDMPDTLATIKDFRDRLAKHFIAFDPADVDEKALILDAMAASGRGESVLPVAVNGRSIEYPVAEILHVAKDIDAQIYARDFKLIDQADMIVSYVPELPGGRPAISSGVERELQHAHETTKDVYVVWQPASEPSPFITETATRVYRDVHEALADFVARGFIPAEAVEGAAGS